MAWSVTYERRHELMEKLEIPTITETREHLGNRLASLVFEQCPQDMKEDLGLESLEGPGDELWISPSNVLKGNLCFSPLPTRKYIQALTHQGILEIGEQIEQKYRNYLEELHRQEIERVEEYMRALCEIQKKRLEEEIRQEELGKYEHQLEMLIDYYEKKIDEIIEAFRNEIREERIKADEALKELDRKWNEKCQDDLTKATEEILLALHNQEGSIVIKLLHKLKRMQAKEVHIVRCIRAKYKQALIQIVRNLSLKHSEKLKQSLNYERKKYRLQLEELKRRYDNEVKQLDIVINNQKEKIDELEQIKNDKTELLKYREDYLKEIIRQFKKFIYYALRAVPTQAEFLLDTAKLKRFEINDNCLEETSLEKKETKEETVKLPTQDRSAASSKISIDLENRPKIFHSSQVLEQTEECTNCYYPSLFETNDSVLLLREKLIKANAEIPVPKIHKDTGSLKGDKRRDTSKLLITRDSVLLCIRNIEKRSINSMKLTKKTSQNILDRFSTKSSSIYSVSRSKFALHTDSLDIIRGNPDIKSNKVDDDLNRCMQQAKQPKESESKLSKTPSKDTNVVKRRIRKILIKKKKIKTTQKQQNKIVGVDDNYPEEFTPARLQSLVNILKDNESLRKLFTAVTR